MKKPPFIKNKIYHVYNRGVEKRKVFMDKQDYLRFIHCLFEFNNDNPTLNLSRTLGTKNTMSEVGLHSLKKDKAPRKLLVEILIFVLMPNHFHLLVKQKKENGVSRFMQKLGTGYTNYFNQKHERVGSLFQGNFKAVMLEEHSHFVHIPYYLHLNPLDLLNKQGPTSFIEQLEFLKEYRWSSFPDYVGKKNFPSVTQRDFLLNFFDNEKKYKKETKEWLKEKTTNLEKIKELTFE
ncbi:MAG: transposase [Patescibacteria group bacterium]